MTMKNGQIADIFDQVADLLEFQGENPFRLRAYRNAAATLRDLTESIATIAKDPERKLTDLAGVGKDLATRLRRWSRPANCRCWPS
jgi:DNA polymerase (family 10)